jgi:dihydrofolate synthase/folylpolyglutamate synthase
LAISLAFKPHIPRLCVIFRSYQQCLDFLYSRDQFSIKLGLERPALLFHLAKIQIHSRRFIHVAGTNGKGSVCRYTAHILKETGFKNIGLFTSPHLVSFRERITVNNKPIGKTWIVKWMNSVYSHYNPLNPTYFEYVTAMAMAYFQDKACDISVIETGLGGRLDATNCLTPAVSVLTPVDLDHMDLLGKTLSAIWREKLGIIKKEVPVIINEGRKRLLKMIHNHCAEFNCTLWNIRKCFPGPGRVFSPNYGDAFETGRFQGKYGSYEYRMRAPSQVFQRQNLAQAFAAVECFFGKTIPLSKQPVELPEITARQQVLISPGKTPLVLDGAHNVKSAKALKRFVHRQFSTRKITVVFSIMSDKEVLKVARIADSIGDIRLYVHLAEYPRALSFPQFRQKLKATGGKWKEFTLTAKSLNTLFTQHHPEKQLLVFFGSFYLIGRVIPLLAAEYGDLKYFKQFSDEF